MVANTTAWVKDADWSGGSVGSYSSWHQVVAVDSVVDWVVETGNQVGAVSNESGSVLCNVVDQPGNEDTEDQEEAKVVSDVDGSVGGREVLVGISKVQAAGDGSSQGDNEDESPVSGGVERPKVEVLGSSAAGRVEASKLAASFVSGNQVLFSASLADWEVLSSDWAPSFTIEVSFVDRVLGGGAVG